jgi:hypothetical protein
MRDRSLLGALLLIGLLAPLSSCTTDPSLTSIAVYPSTETASLSAGLQTQFTAIGSYTHPGHTAETKDITNEVTWKTANPQMVTISSSGLATVTGQVYGNTTVFASAPGFDGDIVGMANFIVSPPTANGGVVAVTIVRSSRIAASPNSTVQFAAIGKTVDGAKVNLTNGLTWTSSGKDVATIDAHTGVATARTSGATAITAVYRNQDGTEVIGTTGLTVGAVN